MKTYEKGQLVRVNDSNILGQITDMTYKPIYVPSRCKVEDADGNFIWCEVDNLEVIGLEQE